MSMYLESVQVFHLFISFSHIRVHKMSTLIISCYTHYSWVSSLFKVLLIILMLCSGFLEQRKYIFLYREDIIDH